MFTKPSIVWDSYRGGGGGMQFLDIPENDIFSDTNSSFRPYMLHNFK